MLNVFDSLLVLIVGLPLSLLWCGLIAACLSR